MSSEEPTQAELAPKEAGSHAKAEIQTPEQAAQAKKRKSIIALSVLLAVLLGIVAAGISYTLWQQYQLDQAAQEMEDTPIPEVVEPEETPEESEEVLVENPIDFEALQAENPDIYAWIYIPGTDVNLPILFSSIDDNYYLDRDQYGEYAIEGSIYTQSLNSTDFSDPVTVIYGHNLTNGTMFTTLHYFEDADFFEEYTTIYIYTTDRILTYQVVSAYQYDDRHILNSFDFTDEDVVRDYFDYVVDPDSLLVNTANDITLDTDDTIIQLSTCSTGTYHGTTRYLVTGVLIDEQPTS